MHEHIYTCTCTYIHRRILEIMNSHQYSQLQSTPTRLSPVFPLPYFPPPCFHGENSGSRYHRYIYSLAQSYATSKIVFRIASCIPLYKTSLPKHCGICLQLTSSPTSPHPSHAQDWDTQLITVFISYLDFFLFVSLQCSYCTCLKYN